MPIRSEPDDVRKAFNHPATMMDLLMPRLRAPGVESKPLASAKPWRCVQDIMRDVNDLLRSADPGDGSDYRWLFRSLPVQSFRRRFADDGQIPRLLGLHIGRANRSGGDIRGSSRRPSWPHARRGGHGRPDARSLVG